MKNLLERIDIAASNVEEAEDRKERFLTKYRTTGEKLYKELAEDEEERIMRICVALSEAYIERRFKTEKNWVTWNHKRD